MLKITQSHDHKKAKSLLSNSSDEDDKQHKFWKECQQGIVCVFHVETTWKQCVCKVSVESICDLICYQWMVYHKEATEDITGRG